MKLPFNFTQSQPTTKKLPIATLSLSRAGLVGNTSFCQSILERLRATEKIVYGYKQTKPVYIGMAYDAENFALKVVFDTRPSSSTPIQPLLSFRESGAVIARFSAPQDVKKNMPVGAYQSIEAGDHHLILVHESKVEEFTSNN